MRARTRGSRRTSSGSDVTAFEVERDLAGDYLSYPVARRWEQETFSHATDSGAEHEFSIEVYLDLTIHVREAANPEFRAYGEE